jgi:putative ABC transport system substrate-binding protein
MIKRRSFISMIGAAAAAWPRTGFAQDGRMPSVGVLTGNMDFDQAAQMRVGMLTQGLADLGWRPNENLRLDVRWPGPDIRRQEQAARELVGLAPDVLLATSTPTTRALRDATKTIPIVFVGLSDPVATGIVSNLARPSTNVTGFSLYEHSLSGKWLSLLKEMAPHVGQVSVFFNPETSPYAPFYLRSAHDMGGRLAVKVAAASVRQAAEIGPTMERLAESGAGGLLVLPDGGFTASHSDLIILLAARYRVPAIYSVKFYAMNGGLMSYGADLNQQFRDGASYVDRILRGASPRDLPVQFPTRFDLLINVRTAAALGLQVPNRLLVEAELIE